MNTLEDLQIYFESKGYLVRFRTLSASEGTGLSVMGRCTSGWINGVELQCYKSYWDVMNMGNDWVLQRPMDQRQHFDNVAELVSVLESVMGPPCEDAKAEREG